MYIAIEKKETEFIDVVTRSSVIQTDVHPKAMLNSSLAI